MLHEEVSGTTYVKRRADIFGAGGKYYCRNMQSSQDNRCQRHSAQTALSGYVYGSGVKVLHGANIVAYPEDRRIFA